MAEYNTRILSKGLGLGRYGATYFFTLTIFSLGILRDFLYGMCGRADTSYERAIRDQPHFAPLAAPGIKAAGVALFLLGQLFVVTSIYQLGIVGTYLGDYCGILMKERVTAFPFNVLEDPMYVGSAMAFLGTAVYCESPAGFVLTALVWTIYSIALKFEGPFTAKIYSSAAAAAAAGKKAEVVEVIEKVQVEEIEIDSPAITIDAPGTPRKSSRLAAAEAEGTPRRRSRRSQVADTETSTSSPMRVTRSRSKAHSGGESD